jgi:hypothetical protein
MLQFSTLENRAGPGIILLSVVLLLPSWTFICCSGPGASFLLVVVVVKGPSMFVISEATAKNLSRLKHCVEVCDTTHQLFGMMWLQHSSFLLTLKEYHHQSF